MEIAKEYKVAFMKARDSFAIRYREKRVNWEKSRIVKTYFSRLPANRLWLTSKRCSWFNKVVYGRPSIKWTS